MGPPAAVHYLHQLSTAWLPVRSSVLSSWWWFNGGRRTATGQQVIWTVGCWSEHVGRRLVGFWQVWQAGTRKPEGTRRHGKSGKGVGLWASCCWAQHIQQQRTMGADTSIDGRRQPGWWALWSQAMGADIRWLPMSMFGSWQVTAHFSHPQQQAQHLLPTRIARMTILTIGIGGRFPYLLIHVLISMIRGLYGWQLPYG